MTRLLAALAWILASTTSDISPDGGKFTIRIAAISEDAAALHKVNIIGGTDDRDSILTIGPSLGLTDAEIARIRRVSGHVGCFLPSPSVGSGTLFLKDNQIITAAHILFERSGTPRSKCFFRNQEPEPLTIDLLVGESEMRVGDVPPRAGSNSDYAVVRLAEPVPNAEPFPVDTENPISKGDRLIVITAHPAGMQREVDAGIPVAQGCTVMRVPISTEKTSFYRTDCDATGSSSGGIHLSRVGDRLVLRGITITSGPWQDDRFSGAPYNERAGSVTTALGTDAAILEAGKSLAGE
jgi:hypothetical protein